MFYAKYSPRGFSNEFTIKAFATRALRDQFVSAVPRTQYSKYYSAWVQNEPNACASVLSAAEVATLTRHDRKDWMNGGCISVAELFNRGERNGSEYEFIDNLDSDGYRVDPSDTAGN